MDIRAARIASRLLLASTVFLAAGFLGRATIIDGTSLSLIWPAAGVAGVWIGSGSRRTLPFDLLALAVATYLVNTLTGAAPWLGGLLVVTNLLQVLVFVHLVRSWAPGLWGFGGDRPLRRLDDLGRLAFAAQLACFLGATVGGIGLRLGHGSVDPASLLVWWGRNTVALVVIVTLCLLVLHPFCAAPPGQRVAVLGSALRVSSLARAIEVGTLLGISVAVNTVIFLDPELDAVRFLLLGMSVWAGLRFAPVGVMLYGLAMGATGIAFTLAGLGPFAAIESPQYRALVSQVFLAMSVLTGLALAFSRAERDLAHAELAQARRTADDRARLLDGVLETMTEGVVVIDERYRVLVRNNAARDLIGMDDVPTASDYGLFHANGLPVTRSELPALRALAGEDVAPQDFHVRTTSVPQGRVVEISAHPLDGDDPAAPRRAMVNLRDVTLDRQHRDTLASFAGVVAHDLFSPLSLVDGWAENLGAEFEQGVVAPTTGLPMVARIHTAADHMREVIADLLAYTVVRDQSLRMEAVDLTTLVRGLARLRAEGPNAPVIAVDDDLSAWADAGLMRQLFDNLLGNATKYVSSGVRPAIAVTGTVLGGDTEIRVTDNGIGIPAEHREQVFETFHRAHDGYAGSGLGLAICHRIVTRHGGRIRIEDGPNRIGSSFVITLPAGPLEAGGLPVLAPLRTERVADLAE